MEIEVLDRRQVSVDLAQHVAELLYLVWPKPQSSVKTLAATFRSKWESYDGCEKQFPRSYLLRQGNQIVGHAELGPRKIGTAAGDLTIGALASVCTHPDFRRQGQGRRLVRAAFDPIDCGVFAFALFQNYAERRRFYEQLGARVIDNQIVNSLSEDRDVSPFWADLAMIYPAASCSWPAGIVDLRGPGY